MEIILDAQSRVAYSGSSSSMEILTRPAMKKYEISTVLLRLH